jgi:hypothetical protein
MEARRDGGFYFSAGDAVAEEKEPKAEEAEEEWDAEYVDALPDESFAYIEPGGEQDEEGKTVPRELRHFPVRDALLGLVAHVLGKKKEEPAAPGTAA